MSQRVDLRCLTSDNSLGHLECATNSCPVAEGVLCSLGIDLDDDDSWVVWATIVLSVAEITNPCLESGAVVLVDGFAIGEELSLAGDGSPLAGRGVDKGKVDVRVGCEVVGLAGLCVCVEDEVDTVALL